MNDLLNLGPVFPPLTEANQLTHVPNIFLDKNIKELEHIKRRAERANARGPS